MSLEMYLDLLSQPCRSVYIFAKKNNIQFDYKKIALFEGQQYTEEFGKVSMLRKVPAIRDGDFCLAERRKKVLQESSLGWNEEKFHTPDHWYPVDLKKRAKVNEYLSWQHSAMRIHGSKMLWFRLLIPAMGIEIPKEKMDLALEDLNASLNLVEQNFLQDKPFICGDQISLADLVAIVEIMQPVGASLDVFEDRPKLRAWKDRVREAIGAELFDEAHQSILSAQEMVETMEPGKMELFKPKILKYFL